MSRLEPECGFGVSAHFCAITRYRRTDIADFTCQDDPPRDGRNTTNIMARVPSRLPLTFNKATSMVARKVVI